MPEFGGKFHATIRPAPDLAERFVQIDRLIEAFCCGEAFGADEVCAVNIGMREISAGKVGAGKVGTRQVGFNKSGATKIGAGELGKPQHRTPHVGIVEARAGEIAIFENVFRYIVVIVP